MTTQLQKALQAYGEKMATKYANKYFNVKTEEEEWQTEFETYLMSFNQAIELTLPLVDALALVKEGLEDSDWECIRCEKDPVMTETDIYKFTCDALADLRKKVGMKNDTD